MRCPVCGRTPDRDHCLHCHEAYAYEAEKFSKQNLTGKMGGWSVTVAYQAKAQLEEIRGSSRP